MFKLAKARQPFTPLILQDPKSFVKQQGRFENNTDRVMCLAIGLQSVVTDIEKQDENFWVKADDGSLTMLDRAIDRENIRTINTLAFNRITNEFDIFIDGQSQENLQAFFAYKDKDKTTQVLYQSSDTFLKIDNTYPVHLFQSCFSVAFYPNDAEKEVLRRLSSRNVVTKSAHQILDKECAVVIIGFLNSVSSSDKEFFDKQNYQKMSHKALPLLVAFVRTDDDKKTLMTPIVVVRSTPETQYSDYQKTADFQKFKAFYQEQLEKEIDKNNDILKDRYLYLAWEIEFDITKANDLEHLKNDFNFPIDDALIVAMRDLENSHKN